MQPPPHLRLRKHVDASPTRPAWPHGYAPTAFVPSNARQAHRGLRRSFPGLVARFEDWHGNLVTDTEYDPALCILAVTEHGQCAGFVQCWTSNFVKDLAVDPAHRGRGLGAALMAEAFARFAARGAPHIDLKVLAEDHTARRLYARLGMIEVEN